MLEPGTEILITLHEGDPGLRPYFLDSIGETRVTVPVPHDALIQFNIGSRTVTAPWIVLWNAGEYLCALRVEMPAMRQYKSGEKLDLKVPPEVVR